VVVTDVPLIPDPASSPPLSERRAVGRVVVSGVQAASLRAVQYTQSLGLSNTRALFFAFDEDEARRVKLDWQREDLDMPLDIIEAPFRDLGEPLLEHLRGLTADPGVVVSVVMPELVFPGWRAALHNQRALYIKRLLLFEPNVLLSSVPFHLP
jgi:hypothetical protein